MREGDHLIEGRWVVVAGLPMFYRIRPATTGNHTPIVLVHGYVVSGRYLVPLMRCLPADRDILAADLPGSGRSFAPRRALTVSQLSHSLLAWSNALGLERMILVGNSFGCQVAADAAFRCPDRVDRLVLVGPTVDPAARSPVKLALRWARDIPFERPSFLPIALNDFLTVGPIRALQTLQCLLADRIEEKLPEIQVPSLVLRGRHDFVAPQEWAERAARLLPSGQYEVTSGAHTTPYGAPDSLASAIRRFIGA